MTPAQAVSRFIPCGAQIALGGFTVNRNPMALIYEIIRQKVRNLHVVCHSHGQGLDLLIGAGCVARLEIAYGGNGRFAPTCVRFRKAVEGGRILWEDYSNYQMSLRFLAGSLGIPFIPTRSGLGTDLVRREGFPREIRKERKVALRKCVMVPNPFADEAQDPVVLLPALTPDVAVIHAQQVGEDGTVRIRGLTFADVEQAKSADAVIVTCEEVVSLTHIRKDPDRNCLPPFLIDAVVPTPFGAHPTACFFHYDYDPRHLNEYRKMAEDDGRFQEYLDRWVYGVKTHAEYLDRVGKSGWRRSRPIRRRGIVRDWSEGNMPETTVNYSYQEMMAISAGRLIRDGDILFAGTGLSMLASTVAKRIHAPKAVVFFETGGIDPSLEELPLAVGDSRVMAGTCLNSGLIDAFSIVGHRRLRTVAFLGAAQIDRYGNINSTCIGRYEKPSIRFSGSGGACDAGSLAAEVIIFMQHEKRRFVETPDYLTSPGWIKGGNSRRKAGLPRGGPVAVVSNLGVMKFKAETREMYLAEYYPGITPQSIAEHTGFFLDIAAAVESAPPTPQDLRILREEIDPQRLILK